MRCSLVDPSSCPIEIAIANPYAGLLHAGAEQRDHGLAAVQAQQHAGVGGHRLAAKLATFEPAHRELGHDPQARDISQAATNAVTITPAVVQPLSCIPCVLAIILAW